MGKALPSKYLVCIICSKSYSVAKCYSPLLVVTILLFGLLLRCQGAPPSFSAMFSEGDNFHDFLFVYLEDSLPKMLSTLKGVNLLQ